MLPLRLPHLLGEQIREVKMIPRSMWRQFANSSSARDKEKESKMWAQVEKNADCTIKSTRQKESDLKPRNSHIPRSEFQTSSRSKLWKDKKIIYLQNQICVLKLYSI
ncbi:hypothetical protein ACFXTN_020906 [Malus domestica]